MAQVLSIISLVSFVVSGICLVLAVVLFVLFRIPNVIGDLSGKNAQKSIAQIRAINEKSGSKSYKTSQTNIKRGKLTGTLQDSEKTKKKADKKIGKSVLKQSAGDDRPETGLLESNAAERKESQATELLDENEQTGLLNDPDETSTLELVQQKPIKPTSTKTLIMLEDIMLIHTDEVI